MIEKFFGGELKKQIMKYCKKLESISLEYDILIFMARKSICFYDALVLNDEIKDLASEVVITTSSRILSYDCDFLKNKKIALLDDMVLKGNTLRETINFLLEKEINDFDVYYIASESFESENSKVIKKYLKEPILELDNNDILVLGNAITSYISASACSYNVDYPVFYMDWESDFFENYIQKNNCASIPCQTSGKTNMYVQNFDCYKYFKQFSISELEALKSRRNEMILKLRIFLRKDSGKRKVVVIPIIVLPELAKEEIKKIFGELTSNELCEMVKNSDENKEMENMLNVIQYILSYQLFVSVFSKECQFEFAYSIRNQDYIFPRSYNEMIAECLGKCEIISSANIKNVFVVDDFFALSEAYRYFFDFIGEKHKKDCGHKAKFTFGNVLEYCTAINAMKEDELRGYISILFDYAIDTGLIVPEIGIYKNKWVRAYRLSEQYELHEREFDLIIYMYNEYQSKSNKSMMGKILTEKLLVLFFREVIMKILNEYKNYGETDEKPQNLFGITYARFGPVVSDNSEEIGVSKESYLTKRLFDNSRSPYKRLYVNDEKKVQGIDEKKIYVKETSGNIFNEVPEEWRIQADLFVKKYCYFEELLDYYEVFTNLNYIKTFDKFLTISAIGNNGDNQLLSLAAELKIYQKVITEKQSYEDIIVAIDSVMDGIINGIWKYICYKTNEYRNCYAIIASRIAGLKGSLDNYNKRIERTRKFILSMKQMENLSNENLNNNIELFLKICICCYGKDNERYIKYESQLSNVRHDPEKCKIVLKSLISEQIRIMYEYIDRYYQQREKIKFEYVDVDKLESLFIESHSGSNRNYDMKHMVEKLMDEVAAILFEILVSWNCIIDYVNNKRINVKITNTDKNVNYLKIAKEILSSNNELKERLDRVEKNNLDFDEIILRFQALEYEIDLLLFCINQYVSKNNSQFIPIQSFFVVKRDDGNVIEVDEIIDAKKREKSLNDYLEFEENDNCAAFVKSKQSEELYQKISNYSGYTLLDYECLWRCNTIIKSGQVCYSKKVKNNIQKILEEYSNESIKITDRGINNDR